MGLMLLYSALLQGTAVTNPDTIDLTGLYTSRDTDSSGPSYYSYAGIRLLTNGDSQRIVFDNWTALETGVQWIDGFTSGDSSAYEAKLVKSTGTTPSGSAVGSYITISSTLTWYLESSVEESLTFDGSLFVREIANHANVESCAVDISVQNGTL